MAARCNSLDRPNVTDLLNIVNVCFFEAYVCQILQRMLYFFLCIEKCVSDIKILLKTNILICPFFGVIILFNEH